MRLSSLLVSLIIPTSALELTNETWDSATTGKVVFVKFFVPWCGHCKSIKPDWDVLMEEFDNYEDVCIAEVDCEGAGSSVCQQLDIGGYPTLMHGDASNLEEYSGSMAIDGLRDFVGTLKPSCGPARLELCDHEKTKILEEMISLSREERNKRISEKEHLITQKEEALAATMNQLEKQFDDDVRFIKNDGLAMLKAINAYESLKKETANPERKREGRESEL